MDTTRELLRHDRETTIARIAELERDVATFIDSASSTTGVEERDPEGSTIGFERAQAVALLTVARAHLEEVAHAERQLEDSKYGICERCGRDIGRERLEARPATSLCIECARSSHGRL